MCSHAWVYRDGRSQCVKCSAWALDLRCCPDLRLRGGRYPTSTDLQRDFTCPICQAGLRARVVDGELRVVCDGPEAHDIVRLGRAVPRRKRDYIFARQEADAQEVLDGLPPALQAITGRV